MRDAEVAYAIHPIVRKYCLTAEDTTEALTACGVPRAANVARITSAGYDRGYFKQSARLSPRKQRSACRSCTPL